MLTNYFELGMKRGTGILLPPPGGNEINGYYKSLDLFDSISISTVHNYCYYIKAYWKCREKKDVCN